MCNLNFIFIVLLGFSFSLGQDLFELPKPNLDSILKDTAQSNKDSFQIKKNGDTVTWVSDEFEYEVELRKFSLYKNANLNYQGNFLFADTIFLFQKQKSISAWGHSYIEDADDKKVFGEQIYYNHQKEIGEITHGSTYQDKQLFNGVLIRRQKDKNLYITKGDFSSCNHYQNPHYFFYSRHMVLTPGDKAVATPLTLNIGNVPIFIAPIMVVPVTQGRRSGFTRPKIGGDQEQGFFIKDVGYFWAINDYMDVKSIFDILEGSEGTFDRVNFKGDYNYKYLDKLSGQINSTAYTKGLSADVQNWEVSFNHNQNLTPDKKHTFKGNGRFVSQANILTQATEEAEALNQTANYDIGYTGPFLGSGSFSLSTDQNWNLSTDQLTRRLPRVSISHSGKLLPDFDKYSWWRDNTKDPSLFEKIQYSYQGNGDIYFQRDSLNDPDAPLVGGVKNSLGISLNHPIFQHINLSPSFNFSHYWVYHRDAGIYTKNDLQSVTLKRSDSTLYDTLLNVTDTIPINQGQYGQSVYKYNMGIGVNTQLFGILEPNIGFLEKVKHTIKPSISFTYTPKIDTNFNFKSSPSFSTSNFQNKQRVVSFQLGNDIDIKYKQSSDVSNSGVSAIADSQKTVTNEKTTSTTKKIFSFNSSTNYDFEKDKRQWGDISSNFSSELVKYVPLNINFVHGLYDDFTTEDQKNKLTVPILKSYSFSWRHQFGFKGELNTGQIDSASKFKWKPWDVNINYSFNFNATRVNQTSFRNQLNHSLSLSANFWLTPEWRVGYSSQYDFVEGEFAKHQFNFDRQLHCWKMTFSWTPVGPAQGWQFKIFAIDIPDIKIEQSSLKIN